MCIDRILNRSNIYHTPEVLKRMLGPTGPHHRILGFIFLFLEACLPGMKAFPATPQIQSGFGFSSLEVVHTAYSNGGLMSEKAFGAAVPKHRCIGSPLASENPEPPRRQQLTQRMVF